MFQQTEILEKLKNEHFELGITESLFICGYRAFFNFYLIVCLYFTNKLFKENILFTFEYCFSDFFCSFLSNEIRNISIISALFDHLGVKTIINADSVLFMDIVKCTLGEPSSSTFYPGLSIVQFMIL